MTLVDRIRAAAAAAVAAVAADGSTRPIAVVRLFMAPLLWTGFGGDFPLWSSLPGGHGSAQTPERAAFLVVITPIFFAATVLMFFGYKSRLGSALAAAMLAIMHFYLGRLHGYAHYVHHHTQLC